MLFCYIFCLSLFWANLWIVCNASKPNLRSLILVFIPNKNTAWVWLKRLQSSGYKSWNCFMMSRNKEVFCIYRYVFVIQTLFYVILVRSSKRSHLIYNFLLKSISLTTLCASVSVFPWSHSSSFLLAELSTFLLSETSDWPHSFRSVCNLR